MTICFNCGANQDNDNVYCTVCGARMDELAPAYSSSGYCSVCNAPLEPDAAFCTACGSPVAGGTTGTRPAGAACSVCGASLEPDAAFCTMCGAPVVEMNAVSKDDSLGEARIGDSLWYPFMFEDANIEAVSSGEIDSTTVFDMVPAVGRESAPVDSHVSAEPEPSRVRVSVEADEEGGSAMDEFFRRPDNLVE